MLRKIHKIAIRSVVINANKLSVSHKRLDPGKPDTPVVTHLVEWGQAEPFTLNLRTTPSCGGPIQAELLVPPEYNEKMHTEAEANQNYSALSRSVEVGVVTNSESTLRIPALSPRGILVLWPASRK